MSISKKLFFIVLSLFFVIRFNIYFFYLIGEDMLLNWTLIFLVIALIAALLGFTGIARESAGIAKILFIVFLIIYVVSLFYYR